jgi:hypothetical protein
LEVLDGASVTRQGISWLWPDSQQREGSRIGVLRPWLLSHDSVKPENGIPYPEAKILAVNSEPAMKKPPISYITMNIPEEIYPLSKINPIPLNFRRKPRWSLLDGGTD